MSNSQRELEQLLMEATAKGILRAEDVACYILGNLWGQQVLEALALMDDLDRDAEEAYSGD